MIKTPIRFVFNDKANVDQIEDAEGFGFFGEKADELCRIVNNHAALVEALEFARDAMEASGGWDGDEEAFDKITQALAAAKGGA